MERNPELRALVDSSGFTSKYVDECRNIILHAYRDLSVLLPDGHVWKEGKLKHVLELEKELHELAPTLGLVGVEVDIIAFLVLSHDIGRLVEAERAAKMLPRPKWLHGLDSVNVLSQHLGSGAYLQLWKSVLLAVEHHSDIKTPTLEGLGGDRAVYAMTTLLRDLDKRTAFLNSADRYTNDPDYKRRQIEANWADQRKQDPTFGEEKFSIEPPEFVDMFENNLLLDRSLCQSYESYMLQFLAWIFDVKNPEILKLITSEGGPQMVMAYLKRQLADTNQSQFERIERTISPFLYET